MNDLDQLKGIIKMILNALKIQIGKTGAAIITCICTCSLMYNNNYHESSHISIL